MNTAESHRRQTHDSARVRPVVYTESKQVINCTQEREKQVSTKEDTRILIVEDNEDMRALLGQFLERAGYRPLLAADGRTALVLANQSHPNLIVMDLALPELSGWEVVEQLRQLEEFRQTPIMAVTAHVSAVAMERARAVGCTLHLGKPCRSKGLLESITRLLSGQAPDQPQT